MNVGCLIETLCPRTHMHTCDGLLSMLFLLMQRWSFCTFCHVHPHGSAVLAPLLQERVHVLQQLAQRQVRRPVEVVLVNLLLLSCSSNGFCVMLMQTPLGVFQADWSCLDKTGHIIKYSLRHRSSTRC